MGSRDVIIKGVEELKRVCKLVPQDNCHNQCPYEDICLAIRAVGRKTNWHTPDMWDLNLIEER